MHACLQVGSPFSGKSTVAHTLAQAFGLKLLNPQQLVSEAVAAAAEWKQQQQQQQGDDQQGAASAHAADAAQLGPAAQSARAVVDPPALVALGLQADEQLQAGQAVSDEVLLQLLLLAMQQAKAYVPAAAETAQPEPPAKGGKGAAPKATAGTKSESGTASASGGRRGSASGNTAPAAAPVGVAAALASGLGSVGLGPALPANLAAGIAGRGFVIDGFPATEEQAVLLEKALTGLDLAAEQELLQGASLITPPPTSKLPQLTRPLLSGLDAVIMLDCADEALALQRVLGRRLDPVTGTACSPA